MHAFHTRIRAVVWGLKRQKGVDCVVNVGKGNLFKRPDGKYLIYLPKRLADDSMFPFRTETSVRVKVSFKIGEEKLLIEPLEEKQA